MDKLSHVPSVSKGWSQLHLKHLTNTVKPLVLRRKIKLLLPEDREVNARYVETIAMLQIDAGLTKPWIPIGIVEKNTSRFGA